jgi:hypothetical protein
MGEGFDGVEAAPNGGTVPAWVPVSSPLPSPASSPVSSAVPARPAAARPLVSSPAPTRTEQARAARRTTARPADRPAPDVSALIGPGRSVRDRLAAAGRGLTRDGLVAGLRQDGHTVSSARAAALLAALNSEQGSAA